MRNLLRRFWRWFTQMDRREKESRFEALKMAESMVGYVAIQDKKFRRAFKGIATREDADILRHVGVMTQRDLHGPTANKEMSTRNQARFAAEQEKHGTAKLTKTGVRV